MGTLINKKLFLLVICGITLMTACTKAENPLKEKVSQLEEDKTKLIVRLDQKNSEIEKLNQNLKEKEKQITTNKKEKELIPLISDLTKEFVKAHTTGDKEKLRELLSKDIFLYVKDKKLYCNNNANDEFVLFSYEKERHLDDWIIQGFQYHSESNTFRVHIREYYEDVNGKPEIPPTFLNLTYKMSNNEWKIVSLSFDV